MQTTRNIKIHLALITNSRYLRNTADVWSTGLFNQLSFSEAEVGEGREDSYRHKHVHKMLISINLFLGVLHKVQKGHLI
jgi:hypothetical protein